MQIIILILLVCFFVFVLFPIVVASIMGISMFAWLKKASELNYTSYTDKFQVTVLAMKSEPNYFSERVRVRCERDMRASIWVTDLKEAGIFETNSPNGEILYREGHPHKIGSSVPIRADGKFSTCDILFTVSTTSSNTVWHDEVAGGTLDTTLPTPLTVSGVQTNWPGSYERDFAIPLANLGDYKILLSVK
jgi:amino acid transporter